MKNLKTNKAISFFIRSGKSGIKSTNIQHLTSNIFLLVVIMFLSISGFSKEHVTMILKNISTTTNTIEYDLFIVNDGSTSLKLSACAYGVNFDASILNGGNVTYSYLNNSRERALQTLTAFSTATSKAKGSHHVQMTTTSVKIENAPALLPNIQFKVGRFKITNSVEWTANSKATLSLQEAIKPGTTTCQIIAFEGQAQTLMTLTPSKKTVATEVEECPLLNASTGIVIRNNQNSIQIAKVGTNTEKIKVYPNPVVDELSIELVSTNQNDLTINIMDLQGRLVKQIQTQTIQGLNTLKIDVSELVKGIYSIKILDVGELNYTQTFSKQ